MSSEIDHEYTDEVICPYCGYEYSDSWEFARDNRSYGTTTCEECNKEFEYQVDTEITYTTCKVESTSEIEEQKQ